MRLPGLVQPGFMTQSGHEVVGIDVDPAKIELLRCGTPPFHEPGLEEVIKDATASDRLTFTTDSAAPRGKIVHFICVGPPQKLGENAADMTYVNAAGAALSPRLAPGILVVGKSTVPVAQRLVLPASSPMRSHSRCWPGTLSSSAKALRCRTRSPPPWQSSWPPSTAGRLRALRDDRRVIDLPESDHRFFC